MMLVGFRPGLGGEQLVAEIDVGNLLVRRLLHARGLLVLDLAAQSIHGVSSHNEKRCKRKVTPRA